tara:strand:- start:982 stop:1476 length:495 start_codon:yes stop_codon:yes gene_type:complete
MFSNTANSTDFFGYQERLEEAMQGALSAFTREILAEVKENGLKGDHAIYLTISTGPKTGVVMSDKLREKWPEELVIALQHQFVLGEVGYEEFEVVLTFSGETELLTIPYDAIKEYGDPSVPFSFARKPILVTDEVKWEELDIPAPKQRRDTENNVVSLDTFRKE